MLHPEWTGVPVFVTDVRDPLHPYTYAQAGRHAPQQQPHRLHAQRGRRSGRHRLDVGLRRRARLLHERPMHYDPTQHGATRTGDRHRPGLPTAGGTTAVPGDQYATQPRAQLVPRDAGVRATARRRRSPRPTAPSTTRPTCIYITQENIDQLHVDERRRLRPLRRREPRRQLRRRGLGGRLTTTRRTSSSSRRSATTRRRTLPGCWPTARSCSAHWFTVERRQRRDRVLRPGHPRPRPDRPGEHPSSRRTSASRRRTGQPGNNSSAAYWPQRLHLHRGLHARDRRPAVHRPDQGHHPAADLLELLLVLADDRQGHATDGGAGASVPATLALTMGHAGGVRRASRRASPRTTRPRRRPTSSPPRVTRRCRSPIRPRAPPAT